VIALPENRSTGYRWMAAPTLALRDRRERQQAPPSYATADTSTRAASESPIPIAESTTNRIAVTETATSAATSVPLTVVADHYAPGWRARTSRQVRTMRRLLAGRSHGEVPVPRISATGRRWLSIQAREEGHWQYKLVYVPAHQAFGPPVAEFRVGATVHEEPAVVHRRALLGVGGREEPPTAVWSGS
jgi:predicted secreted protein